MNKAQRRRMRRIRSICFTIIVVVIVVAGIFSVNYFKKINSFKGEYRRTVDISDEIATNIAVWLSEVEGAEIDVNWIRDRAGNIEIVTTMTWDKDGLNKGSYSETISSESYDECCSMAYTATASCLRELIAKRLIMIGYKDSIPDDEADQIISEALGMNLDSYIKNAGIQLVPSLDELKGKYEDSGSFKVNGKTITLSGMNEEITSSYATSKENLVLIDSGVVYTKGE